MAEQFKFQTSTVLSWVLGVFFLALGIQEAINYGSGSQVLRDINQFFGGRSDLLSLVFAIIEIVCGVLLVIAPLGLLKSGASSVALAIVAIFWIVRIVFAFFIDRSPLKPDSVTWIRDFALYLVVLVAIWSARPSKR